MKLTVGQIAKIKNLTKRTIRYYEELNLIKPSEISSCGYKYYNENILKRLELIDELKKLGYTLNDIKEIIDRIDDSKTGKELSEVLEPILNKNYKIVTNKLEAIKNLKDNIDRYFNFFKKK
ncbi:MAG: hypothetical protein KatS3mg068_2462 [Candidatus Sericytochromatia bacterium]|nr:MAG: hypothetical protein KatS3mg068_2462 [Candidatus Sericytochromatia bacterium]